MHLNDLLIESTNQFVKQEQGSEEFWNCANSFGVILAQLFVFDSIKIVTLSTWLDKVHNWIVQGDCAATKHFITILQIVLVKMKKQYPRQLSYYWLQIVNLWNKRQIPNEFAESIQSINLADERTNQRKNIETRQFSSLQQLPVSNQHR